MSPNQFLEDNYLPCRRYADYEPASDGFARFQDPETNEWYFALHENQTVILRSEGYSNENGRDNGIESVKRNMDDDENYNVILQPDGKWVLSLRAANKKEIARSCRFDTEEEARQMLPSARKKDAVASSEEQDDYLECSAYDGHERSESHPDFGVFEAEGHYLFAMYDEQGDVLLRSERYSSAKGRDKGIESVVRNRDSDDMYEVVNDDGDFFLVLRAANRQEIARSCPLATEAAALALLPSARAAMKAQAATKPRGKEDDYLACREYEGHERSSEYNDFALFEKRGEYYFALVDENGDVLLRSEGYNSTAARAKGIASVIRNRPIEERYSTEEHLGYHFVILKASNHQEIARSCPKSEAAALALIGLLTGAAVSTATVAAATAATATATATPVVPASTPPAASGGGVPWWVWLLGLLLLVLLFFLWRGCNSNGESAETETASVGPVYLTDDDCGWSPILFGFDSDSITPEARQELRKVATVLRSKRDHRALLIGFSDNQGREDYNVELSLRRAKAAADALEGMGISANRISTDEQDEHNPVASNREEAGRRFNRRVVMYVLDPQNRLVCKQIALEIPDELKAN